MVKTSGLKSEGNEWLFKTHLNWKYWFSFILKLAFYLEVNRPEQTVSDTEIHHFVRLYPLRARTECSIQVLYIKIGLICYIFLRTINHEDVILCLKVHVHNRMSTNIQLFSVHIARWLQSIILSKKHLISSKYFRFCTLIIRHPAINALNQRPRDYTFDETPVSCNWLLITYFEQEWT